MRPLLCLVLSVGFIACSVKGRIVHDEPAWISKQGRLEVRIDLVKAMVHAEQSDEALAMINVLREEGQQDPRLDLLQGKCMASQGLFTEAEALLIKARDVMKKSPIPFHELGLLYADSGTPERAITAFRQAVTYDESRASDWNNLGFLLFSEQRYEEATIALRTAVSTNPTVEKYRTNLAFSLFGEQKHEEALRVFKSVLTKADAHYNMGVAHELSGDASGAQMQYSLATTANPKHKAALAAKTRLTKIKEPSE